MCILRCIMTSFIILMHKKSGSVLLRWMKKRLTRSRRLSEGCRMNYTKVRPYLMILPAIIIFALFFLYPIGYMIFLSFHDWNFVSPEKDFVGIDNFKALLSDAKFMQVLRNTFVYSILTVSLTISISL